MKIKIKTTEPMPYGYEIKSIETKAMCGSDGPFTHIDANFRTLNEDYTIPFDVKGNGLLTRIAIIKLAKSLKNKNIAECIHEFIKFVNIQHTIMGAAYQSIIENTPIEVIESINGLSQVYDVIPKKYRNMADICLKKKCEQHNKYHHHSNNTTI